MFFFPVQSSNFYKNEQPNILHNEGVEILKRIVEFFHLEKEIILVGNERTKIFHVREIPIDVLIKMTQRIDSIISRYT